MICHLHNPREPNVEESEIEERAVVCDAREQVIGLRLPR